MLQILKYSKGLSLIELVVTITILGILAAGIMPMASMTAKRTKELELRRDLRIIRTALDEFKKTYDKAVEDKKIIQSLNKNVSGYPESLTQLVEGYDFGGAYPSKKKFLRRLPVDPFNPVKGKDEEMWGLRSYNDKADSTNWGGEDVYDVYSLSQGTAIDGTKYNDW